MLFPMLVKTSVVLALVIATVSGLVLGREWFRSRRAAWFRRKLERHSALTERLRTTEPADSEAAIRDLEALSDPSLREAILDAARETESEASASIIIHTYERLGIVDRYIHELEHASSWEQRAMAAERLGQIGSGRAAACLIGVVRDTKDEDEDVRGVALRALGRIRDPRVIPELIEALGDPTLPSRVAEIITMFGEHAVRPLIAELRNFDSDLRRMWAAEILGWLADDRAGVPLVESLGDVSPEVRAKAAGAIGKLGESRAVDRLLEMLLSDPVPFVRTRVAQALGAIGHPKVIDHLIHVLKDPEWWVRIRAIEALEQIGSGSSGALLIALEDEDAEIRTRAGMALERMGYVEQCLNQWETSGFRADVWKVLLTIGRTGVTEVLFGAVNTLTGPARSLLVRLIGDIGNPGAGPILREALAESDDPRLRSRIIGSLGKLTYRQALPDILTCLRDEDDWVRRQAVKALSALGPADHVEELRKLLRDPLPATRKAVCQVLARVEDPVNARAIQDLLTDPVPTVRAEALQGMRRLRFTDAEADVRALLLDASDEVRLAAAWALTALGGPESVESILGVAENVSDEMLEALGAALSRCHTGPFTDLLRLSPDGRSPGQSALLLDVATSGSGGKRLEFISGHLDASDHRLRRRAVLALQGFGASDVKEALRRAVRDPQGTVREAAVTVATVIEGLDLRREIQSLARDPHELVRLRVALALGLSVDPEVDAVLDELGQDSVVEVRAGAAMALALRHHTGALPLLKPYFQDAAVCDAAREIFVPDSVDPLVTRVVLEAKAGDRLETRLFLGGSRFELERELAQRAQEALDPDEREQALSLCEVVATGQSNPAALSILKNDPAPAVRARALDLILRTSHDPEIAGVVGSVLMDPHPDLRVKAARALADIDRPEAMEALVHALDTTERGLRDAVTTSLSEHLARDPKRAEELIAEIPSNKTRKLGLVWLLGKSRRKGAMKVLLRFLEDDDGDVRSATVGALAKYQMGIVARFLRKALSDPSPRVRAAAVNALARIRSAEGETGMEGMLTDPDSFVRQRAAMALIRMRSAKAKSRIRAITHESDDLSAVWAAGGVFLGVLSPREAQAYPTFAGFLSELFPLIEADAAVRTSTDPARRLTAFRVLQALSEESAREAAQLLQSDPDPTLRDEAETFAGKRAA